ncbi:Y-family DNA polymerase [Massilia sp. LjRoot122]|uniref:Y-family DNA polymerase n=1 Tax=Massilia sp. LjRoot122 TaxID=3342257 RepID=UPI003ECC632D
MRLWIGLHLRLLSLEVFEPNWSSDGVSVVLEQERVLVMSRAARAAGVKPGMRRGGVLMLAPDAKIYERSSASEDEALQAVALALLQYSPLVALAEESSLVVDIGASLRLFRGIRALCRRVQADMRRLGFSVHLSCAPTARGAWILARCGGGRTVKTATMTRRLNVLPALVVPPVRPFSAWFEGIGCETIADLRRLPRPGLQRRCGRPLLDILDHAFGTAPEFFEWVVPAETFEAKLELFGRIENAELLLAGAQRLVLQLTGWLVAKHMAAERVTLKLDHERGRTARPPTAVEITLAEPVWDGDHIIRLMKERLGKLDLEAPVIGLALQVDQLQAMEPPSESLFPEPGGSEEDQVRMLELLVSRIGADKVRRSKPVADHRPEVANAWVSVQEKIRDVDIAKQLPPDIKSLLRPTWLLATPIPLLVRHNRPFYGSPLRMVQGPERVEAAWWDATAARDYFIAEGQGHELFYVYRERIMSAAGENEPRWFLHGLFG